MDRLEEIENQMALNQNDLEHAAMDYFTYKREVDVLRAKTLRTIESGTVAEREARVTEIVAASDLWGTFVKAEAAYESLRLAQRSLGDRASIGQSILRTQQRAAA